MFHISWVLTNVNQCYPVPHFKGLHIKYVLGLLVGGVYNSCHLFTTPNDIPNCSVDPWAQWCGGGRGSRGVEQLQPGAGTAPPRHQPRYSTEQYSIVQYSTVQYNTVQYSTVLSYSVAGGSRWGQGWVPPKPGLGSTQAMTVQSQIQLSSQLPSV